MVKQPWYLTCSMGLWTTLLIIAAVITDATAGVAQPKKPNPPPSNKPTTSKPTTNQKVSFVLPTLPNVGRSSNRRGAATRSGSCPAVSTPLTALAPMQTIDGDQTVLSLTTASHPTLWFYVPYAITPDRPAELRVETTTPDSNILTQRTVAKLTNAAPGIIGIRIPPTEASLSPGQKSEWTFVVRCSPKDASANKFVEMTVKRIEPAPQLAEQIKAADGREQVILFAQSGFWENSLTTLANLRQRSPKDTNLATDWIDLMASVNLEDIANRPIVQIYTP